MDKPPRYLPDATWTQVLDPMPLAVLARICQGALDPIPNWKTFITKQFDKASQPIGLVARGAKDNVFTFPRSAAIFDCVQPKEEIPELVTRERRGTPAFNLP